MSGAGEQGWIDVAKTQPPVGERVMVRHELNPSYDCTGELTSEGRWACSNAFILPNMMMVWSPTHWHPIAEQERGK